MGLDAEILAAELAVRERNLRLRQRAHDVVARARSGTGRAVAIAAAAAIGGTLAFVIGRRLWGRAHPDAARRKALARRRTMRRVRRRMPLPLRRLAALAWPMLPAGLTAQVPAGLALLLGLPAAHAAGKAARPEPPAVAPDFDLARYAGTWYEIARLPYRAESRCVSDARADYRLEGGRMQVVNRCRHADGSEAAVQGEARPADAGASAKLEVSFAPQWLRWLPPVWADYWVLYVDPAYTTALVGTPDRECLWLLARIPALAPEERTQLLTEARLRGYDTARLQETPQHDAAERAVPAVPLAWTNSPTSSA